MKLYTAKQLAEALQLHEETVRRLGREGKLERVKIGASVRFAMPQIGENHVKQKIKT